MLGSISAGCASQNSGSKVKVDVSVIYFRGFLTITCNRYENFRLYYQNLDMDLLLGYSENENISGWRESVICELGQYIANTGRLFSRVADGNAPQ